MLEYFSSIMLSRELFFAFNSRVLSIHGGNTVRSSSLLHEKYSSGHMKEMAATSESHELKSTILNLMDVKTVQKHISINRIIVSMLWTVMVVKSR